MLLVALTLGIGLIIIYVAIFPPAEEKEQLSTSIFNKLPPPEPIPGVTKEGKKYSTIWPNVPEKHRKCRDGGRHSGSLEIVTWDTPYDPKTEEALGWGADMLEESAALKTKFEEEFNCNFEKLYDHWPRGFRWICCGLAGDYKWGCDHHFYPGCRCDNCRHGFKLPRGHVADRDQSAHAKGLSLGVGNVNGKDFD